MGVTNFDEYRDVFVVADTIDDVVRLRTNLSVKLVESLRNWANSFKLCFLVRMFNPRRRNLWHMVPILFTFLKALF